MAVLIRRVQAILIHGMGQSRLLVPRPWSAPCGEHVPFLIEILRKRTESGVEMASLNAERSSADAEIPLEELMSKSCVSGEYVRQCRGGICTRGSCCVLAVRFDAKSPLYVDASSHRLP